MNIYITTFYNVRNLQPWEIPVSTAAWDPRWFHEGKGPEHVFKDKRGVINGLRLEELNPQHCNAVACCPCSMKDPTRCEFISSYKEGLRRNDFDAIIDKLRSLESLISIGDFMNYGRTFNIVLLVYEAESNPCSERQSIIEYFAENGIEVKEWRNGGNNYECSRVV